MEKKEEAQANATQKTKFNFLLVLFHSFFLHFIFIHCAGLLLPLMLRLPVLPLLALGFLFLHTYTGLYMCNIHIYDIRSYLTHTHTRTHSDTHAHSLLSPPCSLVRSFAFSAACGFIYCYARAIFIPFFPIVFYFVFTVLTYFSFLFVFFACVVFQRKH